MDGGEGRNEGVMKLALNSGGIVYWLCAKKSYYSFEKRERSGN
jgi:hypothetical protein